MAAICSSRISIRRCAPSTFIKAIAVSDSTSSRTAVRWIAATSRPACPAAMRASRFPNQLEGLADLQRCLGGLCPQIDARTEGIVLFVGHLRIKQSPCLDTLTARDADVALSRGETRARGKCACKRVPHRQGLRMRGARQPGANQKCGHARDLRDCLAKHENDRDERRRLSACALREHVQVRCLGGGVSNPG